MSDIINPSSRASSQERLLQIMLLSFMVPLQGGGGLAFPIGFPGAGYRLDDWQFDKYRALLDQRLLSTETIQGMRRARLTLFIVFGFVAVGNVVSFYFFQENAFGDYARQWFPVLWIAPFALVIIHSYLFNYRNFRAFKKHFDGSPRVPRGAYLQRRLLGYLVAIAFSHLNASFLAFITATLGLLFLLVGLSGATTFHMVLTMILLIIAAINSCLLFVYWNFRRVHGRGPNEADLKPVHYPSAKPP